MSLGDHWSQINAVEEPSINYDVYTTGIKKAMAEKKRNCMFTIGETYDGANGQKCKKLEAWFKGQGLNVETQIVKAKPKGSDKLIEVFVMNVTW